jgi:hypothetical protein
MRALLWTWIVGMTALLLFFPPMMEKERPVTDKPVVWSNVQPLRRSIFDDSFQETHIRIPRLIAAILAPLLAPLLAP